MPTIIRREVEFDSGPDRLAGTLHLGEAAGPRAGIVIVHGSGPVDRMGAEGSLVPVVAHLVRSGYAVLTYDKPGVGKSSGNWTAQTFADRAGETLSAAWFLAAQPEVRADAVGLWGISQGGWIAPLAAAASPARVAFMILVSSCPISPAEQVEWLLQQEMAAEGATEAQIAGALRALGERTAAMAAGTAAAEILTSEARIFGDEPWYYQFVSPPEEVDFMRAIWNFDPVPVLTQLRCPVLAIWGDRDLHMPVPECVRIFDTTLTQAANENFRLEVFHGANHRLRKDDGDFVPGYLELMTSWLSCVTGLPTGEQSAHVS